MPKESHFDRESGLFLITIFVSVRTVEAADTLLKGGETLERELASASTQLYFLPGEVIVREMNLAPWVFIVHRGKIMIRKEDENLALLSKVLCLQLTIYL